MRTPQLQTDCSERVKGKNLKKADITSRRFFLSAAAAAILEEVGICPEK